MARGWPRKLLRIWLLALGVAWPASGHAEQKARLVYVRGAGVDDCPGEVDLRLLVMARLGYDPFSPQASRVVISRVEARGDLLISNLEVIDEGGISNGQRELTAKPGRCGELARALALSISLAIDPERASQPSTVVPATPPEDTVASAEQRAPAPEPKPLARLASEPAKARAEPPHTPRGFAALALVSSIGTLPGLSVGGTASLGLRLRPVAVSFDALGQVARPRELQPRGQLEGALFGGGFSLCAVSGAWEACAAARAAAQRLAGSEVERPGASYGLLLGLGPRLAWALPLGRELAFVAALEGLLHLTRNSAHLSGRQVWRTPPLSGSLQLGVRTLFL